MLDVVEYVRADDTPRDLYSFSVLLLEFQQTFACKPMEIRLGVEAYLGLVNTLGGISYDPLDDRPLGIGGVPVKLLPESYPNSAVMLVKGVETHAVGEPLDQAAT